MRRQEQRVDEILDRFLDRFRNPSPNLEQTEAAGQRALERLRWEGRYASKENGVAFVPAPTPWNRRPLTIAAVAAAIVLVLTSSVIIRTFVGRAGVHAVVQTVDGSLYRVSAEKPQPVRVGERIETQQPIRSNEGAGAVLALSDGSRVEMRSQSEVSLESAADGIRIMLNRGSVIVSAEKQRIGHLYVRTKDLTVSVVGTVFLVETSDAGSHVTVIQGEVEVRQGGSLKRLLIGEQVASAPVQESLPVGEEISWSRSYEAYMTALAQAGALPARREFESASITRQSSSGETSNFACRGINGVWRVFSGSREPIAVPQGGCAGDHVTPSVLISAAYDVKTVEGGPGWVYGGDPANPAEFQIHAKADDPSTTTTDELKQMLQPLLANRFKLRLHRGTKEMPGYVLAVAASGPRLQETSEPEEEPNAVMEGRRLTIRGKSSIKKFAEFLPRRFPNLGVVLDKTGLDGTYDYTLRLPVQPDAPIFSLVRDQLGLQLQPQTVAIETVVVDQIQKPSQK